MNRSSDDRSDSTQFSLDGFDALLATPVSTRSLAVLRVAVGALAFVHLRSLTVEAFDGDTHHGRFHEPYVDAFAATPVGPYQTIMTLGTVAAAAMTIGLLTRVAAWATFGVVAFHLLISTTHVHNNRAYLVTILLLLAMSPTGRSWSADRWLAGRRARPPVRETTAAWSLWLIRFACATVYFASGFSKLIDPEWFGGTVTWGRVTLGEDDLRSSILPGGVVDVILDRSFHTFAAKGIVLTELFIACGLWWRRTRPWAVLIAIVFHVMIEISSNVQLFSWLAIAVLVAWADPDLRGLGTWRRDDSNAADSRPGGERQLELPIDTARSAKVSP